MKALAVLVAGLALLAVPAVAQEPGAEEAKPEKKVCKTEKITGSLTRVRRTCMTQRDWDRFAEGSRRAQDVILDDGNQTYAEQLRLRDGQTLPTGTSPSAF